MNNWPGNLSQLETEKYFEKTTKTVNSTTFCIINMVCLSVGKLRDLGNWDAADTEMLFHTLQIRLKAVAQIYQTYYRHVKQKFQCTVANPIA